MSHDSLTLVVRASRFAAGKHERQKRKGEHEVPYINHPLEVARILSEEGGVTDPVILAAAVLHDTIEDTPTTEQELRDQFGPGSMS
jgi:guanosine-3',5'-bis(diphosphate) 3'-pyrophosphohydrolase